MFVDCIFLIKNGVPWVAVFGKPPTKLSATRRFSMAVVLGTLDGGVFNWDTREWQRRDR